MTFPHYLQKKVLSCVNFLPEMAEGSLRVQNKLDWQRRVNGIHTCSTHDYKGKSVYDTTQGCVEHENCHFMDKSY